MSTIIYVLKLENDKYYVGKTDNIEKRFKNHCDGTGSVWTSKYKPISLLETRNIVSQFDEDIVTKEYMLKFGIDNVRGGSYVYINLASAQKQLLEKELNTVNDSCFRCGRSGHFVKECYAHTHINGNKLGKQKRKKQPKIKQQKVTDSSDSSSDSSSEEYQECMECLRCGYTGHTYNQCYAKRDRNGNILTNHNDLHTTLGALCCSLLEGFCITFFNDCK